MKAKTGKAGNVTVSLDDNRAAPAEAGVTASEFGRIRRLLVPVDFSPNSRKAVAYAAAFAQQFGATITFLHVVQANYPYGEFGAVDVSALESRLRAGAEQELSALVLEARSKGLDATSAVREGSPARQIAEFARETGTDLLVISTHGYTGLQHVLMGSIAEHVVRYAPCPVLVVRQQEQDFVRAPVSA